MKNLWSTGLLFSLLLSACRSSEALPEETLPQHVTIPSAEPASPPAPEPVWVPPSADPVPEARNRASADPGYFARYLVTTDPPGVGVLREGGDLIGLTPLTITLDSPRAIRLTFLKKGYGIVGRFIRPEPGNQTFHLVMVADPEEVPAAP